MATNVLDISNIRVALFQTRTYPKHKSYVNLPRRLATLVLYRQHSVIDSFSHVTLAVLSLLIPVNP